MQPRHTPGHPFDERVCGEPPAPKSNNRGRHCAGGSRPHVLSPFSKPETVRAGPTARRDGGDSRLRPVCGRMPLARIRIRRVWAPSTSRPDRVISRVGPRVLIKLRGARACAQAAPERRYLHPPPIVAAGVGRSGRRARSKSAPRFQGHPRAVRRTCSALPRLRGLRERSSRARGFPVEQRAQRNGAERSLRKSDAAQSLKSQ